MGSSRSLGPGPPVVLLVITIHSLSYIPYRTRVSPTFVGDEDNFPRNRDTLECNTLIEASVLDIIMHQMPIESPIHPRHGYG